jgi:hypothetical protein
MVSQPSGYAQARGNKRVLVVLGIVGLCIVALLGVGGAYLIFSGHNTAGLEGTWRDPANPRHTHRFQPSGGVDTWHDKLPMERFVTWRRDGQQIIVRTTRGWDFEGQLEGEMIRGKMIIRDEKGAVVNTTDTVWRKE